MARKVLSAAERKALALDLKRGKVTNVALAKKYEVSTKTIERFKEKNKGKKPVSVLTMKRSLELSQMSSMMIFYLEVLERQTRILEGSPDDLNKVAKGVCEVVRENLVVTLNIHNSLAFTEIPEGTDDYSDMDISILEAILEMIPPEKRAELNAKISKLTAREGKATDDTVQQERRAESGAIPTQSG